MNKGARNTFLLCILLLTPTLAFAGVSGTSSVDYGTGEFEGYWCYTIDFTWDSPMDLSNVSVFVGLEGLVCACDPGLFVFPTPAGTSTGTGEFGECTLDYVGSYLCAGDPSLPPEYASDSAVRFDPEPELCNAGTSGSGSVTFYSLLAPGDPFEVHPDAISFKSGLTTYLGNITGPLPQADCSVPEQEATWGQLKAMFDH
jgi:hypothetical protein